MCFEIKIMIMVLDSDADDNKCIGDDTKVAARQSLNCIKNQKKLNMEKNDFQYAG